MSRWEWSTVVEWLIAALVVAYFGWMGLVITRQAEECRVRGGEWEVKLIRCDYPDRPFVGPTNP